MQDSTKENGRRKLTGLVVAAAVLLAASPALARNDSTPVRASRGAARAATGPADHTTLRLNLGYFDRAGLPVEVIVAMQTEVERVLAGLDVEVVSLDATALMTNENQPEGTLLNVVVWGHVPEAWDVPRHTMGVCPNKGKMPRSVYVFESNVRRELGLASQGLDAMRAEDVGRAFGRVAAHEIIHAFATFAGEDRHRGNGLMGEQLDRDTLLRPGLSVDERSGDAFRTGLGKAAGIG